MDFSNDIFLIGISTGVISVAAGLILLKFPPKNINFLYGYRTKASMRSKEAWDFAQRYSARHIIKGGLVFLLLGIVGPFLNLSQTLNFIIGLGALLLFCTYLIFRTEKQLKQKFNKSL